MHKPRFADYVHLHFIVLIWGFTAILGLLLEPLTAPALVFYRTLLAAAGLGVVLALRSRQNRPNHGAEMPGNVVAPPTPPGTRPPTTRNVVNRDRWRLLATGGLIALHWITFFGAARLANASVCLAGMATGSLWTSLLEPLLLRRRIRAVEVVMGVVVMAGLYLIFRFEVSRVAGLLMAVFSAMLSALFTVINSRFAQRHDALTISFYEMTGAALGATVFLGGYVVATQPTFAELIPTRPAQGLWLAALALVCTVYAYTAGVRLLRKFSAFMAVLTVNLEPVYGIVLAYLVFGESERMTPGFYAGTLVILLAVLAYPYLNRRLTRPAVPLTETHS